MLFDKTIFDMLNMLSEVKEPPKKLDDIIAFF